MQSMPSLSWKILNLQKGVTQFLVLWFGKAAGGSTAPFSLQNLPEQEMPMSHYTRGDKGQLPALSLKDSDALAAA